MDDFLSGVQARISGIKADPALNGQNCVSLGKAVAAGRVQVRLPCGRDLSIRAENLCLAGDSAGTLASGCRVILVGLAKAPELNGREGCVVGPGEAGSGRFLVDLGEDAPKALKAENLVLVTAKPTEEPEKETTEGAHFVSDKQKAANKLIAAAAVACPVGSRVQIHGLVEEKGRDNTGDPALNEMDGIIQRADPDEPGRLIVKVNEDKRKKKGQDPKEARLKSIAFTNLTWLDAPAEPAPATESTALVAKRPGSEQLQLAAGAGGKRCKITEIAIAAGDKHVSFVAANRNRNIAVDPAGNSAENEAARANALIYARMDAVSLDDEVAEGGLTRLAQLCPRFPLKAVCILGVDVVANGSGKTGSKTAELIDKLALWLTGGEQDGILRKILEAGQACAGEADGLSACRRSAEKGIKGGRLLGLVRKNAGSVKDFVGRGCRER